MLNLYTNVFAEP